MSSQTALSMCNHSTFMGQAHSNFDRLTPLNTSSTTLNTTLTLLSGYYTECYTHSAVWKTPLATLPKADVFEVVSSMEGTGVDPQRGGEGRSHRETSIENRILTMQCK